MTTRELAELVADLRAKQSEYFRTKSQSDLVAAKAAEKRVDEAVHEILDQPQLFQENFPP